MVFWTARYARAHVKARVMVLSLGIMVEQSPSPVERIHPAGE
jgi:hypothetical protein